MKKWLTSPVVAGRLDEIGRSLERRRVIKEEEEIKLSHYDQRVPDAERGADAASVRASTRCWGTLLNDSGGRLEIIVVDSSPESSRQH